MRHRRNFNQKENQTSLILEHTITKNLSTNNIMKFKDRTDDFSHLIKGYLRTKNKNELDQQPLLPKSTNSLSFFGKEANIISKAIITTTRKLEELGKLAKKSSLFDDPSVEISQLSSKITQDITMIKDRIAHLKQLKSDYSNNNSTEEHSGIVVKALDRNVARVTQELKTVLEVRTHNVEQQQKKKQKFTGVSTVNKRNRRPKTNALYYKNISNHENGDSNGDSKQDQQVVVHSPNQSQMQSQLQYEHNQANVEAVEKIEQTLIELTDIFKEMSILVAQQGEDIQRIDQNVDDVLLNLESSQSELMKRLKSMTSNRSLIFKMFFVLIFFIVIFFLFFI
eukprot:TRINITY_DN3645_c0_g1_i1.p1 TRINITY_DN3645_c0_g1~~TRINITY_DN3645_c0_g1_i1.p1  ORF type:complete len:338 (-),score=71.59 TRINITY_DN3645_c0_g1_i1:44-1057(-)